MPRLELAFTRVSVAGRPPVDFCVDLETGDPIAAWLLDHDAIDEPVMRALLDFVGAGRRVLDLGSHLGTFSLPAAALGAEVLAIDADPMHVQLLREAARRNGFDSLRVFQGALMDGTATVPFLERSIHGRVWRQEDPSAPTIDVPTLVLDDLLDELGWDAVDVIKMDVEGGETAALRGLRRMHARGARPPMVFECNGGTLPLFDSSVCQLRQMVADLGYELLLIDHLRPGVLVAALPDGVQPESASDLLAVADRTHLPANRWRVDPPFSHELTVIRVADSAASDGAGYRAYAADLLTAGPHWLRSDPLVAPLRRALELDVSDAVRRACRVSGDSPAREHASTPPPLRGCPPENVLAVARGLCLREPHAGPDRAGSARPAFEELALADASFHVKGGEVLAVLDDDASATRALMRALGGLERTTAGQLERSGHAILISQIDDVFEPRLTIAENVMFYGALLGCHVREVRDAIPTIMERAGLDHPVQRPLADLPGDAASRLALTVALLASHAQLIAVHRLGAFEDPGVRRHMSLLITERLAAGGAVVQSVIEPDELLVRAERMLWLADGQVLACGHAESVVQAARHVRSVVPDPQPAAGTASAAAVR